MDLAGREGEVDAVVGDDAGKPLDDPAELDRTAPRWRRPSVLGVHPEVVDAGGCIGHGLAPAGIAIWP